MELFLIECLRAAAFCCLFFFEVSIFQALISDGQRRVNHTLAKTGSGCLPFASENHSLTTGEDVPSLSPAFFKPWTKGPWCRELIYT